MSRLQLGFARLPGGLRLRFRCLGDEGPTVLLLHGWPQTGHAWHSVLPTLAASGCVCIAPDLRGAGDSDKPSDGYEAVSRMEDVRALVFALGLDGGPLLVVGHGEGGAETAHAYAALHPDEVAGAAFVSVLPGHSDAKNGWHDGFHRTPDLPELLLGAHLEAYLSHFFQAWSHDPGMLASADLDVYVRALAAPGALRASLAPFRVPPAPALPPCAVPRLLVLGESDPRAARLLDAALLEGVRVVSVPRGGFWLPEERPDPLAAALLTFFREVLP